ncbi:MAG: metallophosphoesterase [Verrucomicrobiota bacterium]
MARVLSIFLCLFSLAQTSGAAPWKFFMFGDTRDADKPVNTNILAELSAEIIRQSPAFAFVAGDLVLSGSLESFEIWTNVIAPVRAAGIAVYPIAGNHDAPDLTDYAAVFGPWVPSNGPAGEISLTYSLVVSNSLVLAFDHNVHPHLLNQAWMDAVLLTNTQPHVFAFGHEPAFKVLHADCLGTYPAARDTFWRSLARARGRLYFAGHDHFYDHMRLDDGDGNPDNDLHQFIVGTGGSPIYGDAPYDGDNGAWTPVRIFHEAVFGYVMVTVDGLNVSVQWWRRLPTGTYSASEEVFSYTAAPPPLKLFVNVSPGRMQLWWADGILQSAPALRGPYSDVAGAASPVVVTNFTTAPCFYRLRSTQ